MGAPQQHRPAQSGYQETDPTDLPRSGRNAPDPDAAGGEGAQVESAQHPKEPGTSEPGHDAPPHPGEDEPLPPGEHKREPIHDPDPADTKMHVQP